tara:strand:- start:19 stop:264 length:246 start_codon:yes stop_codon:yes gene_type:complete
MEEDINYIKELYNDLFTYNDKLLKSKKYSKRYKEIINIIIKEQKYERKVFTMALHDTEKIKSIYKLVSRLMDLYDEVEEED